MPLDVGERTRARGSDPPQLLGIRAPAADRLVRRELLIPEQDFAEYSFAFCYRVFFWNWNGLVILNSPQERLFPIILWPIEKNQKKLRLNANRYMVHYLKYVHL